MSRKGPSKAPQSRKTSSAPIPILHSTKPVNIKSTPTLRSSLYKDGRIGVSSKPMPRGSASDVRVGSNKLGKFIEVDGHEYIATISIANDAIPGDILFQRPNTVAIANTRLAQFAAIYERWEPITYNYHFISTLPSTTTGGYVMVSDPDPSNPWTTGVSFNIPNASSMAGCARGQFWEGSTSSLPSERDYTSLWCRPATVEVGDPEDRLSAAGQFVFICLVPTGTSAVVGFIELEYRIRFYLPRLTNNASSSVTVKVPIPALFNSPTRPSGSSTVGVIAGTIAYLKRSGVKIDEDKILRAFRDAVSLPFSPPASEPSEQSTVAGTSVGLPNGSYNVSAIMTSTAFATTDPGAQIDTAWFSATSPNETISNGTQMNGAYNSITTGQTTVINDVDPILSQANPVYFAPDGTSYGTILPYDWEFYAQDGKVSNGIADLVLGSGTFSPTAYLASILYLTFSVTGNEHYYNPSVSSSPLPKIACRPFRRIPADEKSSDGESVVVSTLPTPGKASFEPLTAFHNTSPPVTTGGVPLTVGQGSSVPSIARRRI